MTTKTVDESTSAGDMVTKRPWNKPTVRIMDAPLVWTTAGENVCTPVVGFPCEEDQFYNPTS